MNSELYILVGLAIGAALGGVIGWLLGQRRTSAEPSDRRLEAELRQQVTQRDSELIQLREQCAISNNARAAAEASREAADKILVEQRQLHERVLLDGRQAQDKALADLREAFRALSSDALQQSQPEFLRLANETLAKFQESAKGDLAQRQQAIATLVKPLKLQLETYQTRLQQSETAQSATLGEVRKHLETLAQQSQSLSNETLQLRLMLGSSQAR